METIHIKINKKKHLRWLAISLIFFVLSLLFLLMPKLFISTVISSKTVILIFGILGIMFFGLFLIYSGRKILNNKLGLFLFDDGLIDTSNPFGFGKIDWEDIHAFKSILVSNKNYILIETGQTEKYLSRIQSRIFEKAARQNLKLYKTPLLIYCASLQYEPKALESLLNSELKKRK